MSTQNFCRFYSGECIGHNWNGVKKTNTLEAVALQLFTSYGWFFVVRFNLKFGWLSVLPNVCNNWFDSLHFKGMKPKFIYYLKKNLF